MMRAIGRADLVRLLEVRGDAHARVACRFLGFEPPRRTRRPSPLEPSPAEPDRDVAAPPSATEPLAPMPVWLPATLTVRRPTRPEPDRGPRLTARDVAGRGGWLLGARAPRPLTPWSRLWPRLRSELEIATPGREPDLARLIRHLADGRPITIIPRRPLRRWVPHLSVWVDRSLRLAPLAHDQELILDRLQRAIGRGGVKVRWLTPIVQAAAASRRGDLMPSVAPGAPVLVLGDLGLCATSDADRARWERTAAELSRRGVRALALLPGPRGRWPLDTVRAWHALPWDDGPAGRPPPGCDPALHWRTRAERLLRVASAAAFVSPGLLRALRLVLPAGQVDAASEFDVWSHPDVIAGVSGLVVSPAAAARWRAELARATYLDDEVLRRIRDTVREWHARLPVELRHAATLAWRAVRSDEPVSTEVIEAVRFAEKVSRTARRGRLARSDARRFGQLLVPSMPPQAFAAGSAGRALVRMYAACFKDVDGPVPAGIDPDVLREEQARLEVEGERAGGGEAHDPGALWQVRQVGARLRFERAPASGVWDEGPVRPGSPVAWLRAAGDVLTVWRGNGPSTLRGQRYQLRDGLEVDLCDGLADQDGDLRLDTDRATLELARLAEPEPWACAIGRDRHGLWADADVLGVVQRFRYIPPGTVRLGSPDDEAGRRDNEGPTFRVTWSRGYWLADTPVTQALWKAVMGDNPSQFQSPTRPVEQVSFEQCEAFVAKLARLERGGRLPKLDARLPSEAEWEYACRAGTDTATWRGDLDLLGDNDAPVLDAIAWYGGNSGHQFDLPKGEDSRGWPKKQYPHTRAGTRAVAARVPNPYGLHDMLGNVWEWCLDPYREYDGVDVGDPEVRQEAGSYRVMRGGSWIARAGYVRAAVRYADDPGDRSSDVGFRLARGPMPGQAGQASQGSPRSGGGLEAAEGRGRPVAEGRGHAAPAERDATPAPARARRSREEP